MAPNWVFERRTGEQAFTETFTPTDPGLTASCQARPAQCTDTITRGLLSGMQPIMASLSGMETVFPDELAMAAFRPLRVMT